MGSLSQPVISYSVSMGDSYLKESIHMIDRKIMSIDLDTTQGGFAVFRIKMEDQVQIGQKIVTIPWDVSISFQEGKNFRVLKWWGDSMELQFRIAFLIILLTSIAFFLYFFIGLSREYRETKKEKNEQEKGYIPIE